MAAPTSSWVSDALYFMRMCMFIYLNAGSPQMLSCSGRIKDNFLSVEERWHYHSLFGKAVAR